MLDGHDRDVKRVSRGRTAAALDVIANQMCIILPADRERARLLADVGLGCLYGRGG